MVDISMCVATSAGHLTRSIWHLLNLLLQPGLVLPFLALLIATPWILRSWPWKHQARLLGVMLLLIYSLGLSPLGAKLGGEGLSLLIPRDSGQTADAIVVLGRGGGFRPSRVRVAADLWRQHRAPLVFASGRGDATEIEAMLERAGVPAAAVDGEPCSATTNENAIFTAALLQPRGIKRLILVTDPPHMARSLLTFRSLGFEVIPHPSPVPNNLDFKHRQFLVLREWAGLIGYGMMGRYFARESIEPGFRAKAGDGVMG